MAHMDNNMLWIVPRIAGSASAPIGPLGDASHAMPPASAAGFGHRSAAPRWGAVAMRASPPGRGAVTRQAIEAPPVGGPAGRATVIPCRTLSTRPQLPQVGTWAGRSTRHIGQTTARSSPSSERTAPEG